MRLVGATLPSHIAGWINDVRTKRSVRDRLLHAEAMAERLIDVLGSVITVHETNRIVMFSDYLSRQIPVSCASNGFRTFRQALLDVEMTRLARLWDSPQWDRNSLQTVYWLTSDPELRAMCNAHVRDTYEPYPGCSHEWHTARQERRWRRLEAVFRIGVRGVLQPRICTRFEAAIG